MPNSTNILEPPGLNLIILSVRWDDISGPSIISIFPLSTLNDPESVALQIYLASVTVFGQHANSQRTEFSVPLLSLGKGMLARVAFDSWEDPSIRGKERPFFLAIITDEDTEKTLNIHFNTYIYEYLDILKEKRENFSSQEIWERITKVYITSSEIDQFNKISFDIDSDYAISRALHDLNIAKNAWDKFRDRKQLWIALRIANRLENIEDQAAGDAFNLIGEIFLENNNFHEAGEAFEKSANAYARIRLLEKSGEASYLAGKCAYYLHEYDKAIELIQAGSMLVKDTKLKASINYNMGIVLHEQTKYEEANNYFERAITLIESVDKQQAAKYFSTYASKLFAQSEREKEKNPTYALSLVKRSAELRKNSARLLQVTENNDINAASSLILAANAYFTLGNTDEGIQSLIEASDLFSKGEDYFSAARSLFDGSKKSKNREQSYKLLSRAINALNQKESTLREDHLRGLILSEKARIEVEIDQISSALVSFESALFNLKKSGLNLLELISVQIQYANLLFKLEDFEGAAKIFLDIDYSNLKDNDSIRMQKDKTITNALISLRRASTAYHNAGVIFLKKEEENHAMDMFAHSVSLLIDWSEIERLKSISEANKVLKDRLNTLKMKNDLLSSTESKYKLSSMLDSLKITLKSF